MDDYIVYRYWSPNNKSYIGQTKQGLDRRAGSNGREYWRNNKCPKFAQAIHKYGWNWFENHREILKANLSYQEACDWEAYYIEYYDSVENGYNILYSDDINNIKIGNHVPVVSIDCITKEVVTYPSCSAAARTFNISSTSINQCIRGVSQTSVGKVWVRLSDYEIMSEQEKEQLKTIKPKERKKQRKPIICLDTGEEFSSIKEAADFYKIDRSYLTKVCKGKAKTCGGKRWKYKEE